MRNTLSHKEKEKYISHITDELSMLRAKAGFTQEVLANYIGVSRQTYYSIENKQRIMSWNTFLSLIFIYSNIQETNLILRKLNIFPNEFVDSLSNDYLKGKDNELNKLL